MDFFISEKNCDPAACHTAGVKARDDADAILEKCGFLPIEISFSRSRSGGALSKLKAHADIASLWRLRLSGLRAGDRVVIQFPAVNHSVFLKNVIKKIATNGVEVIALIHDLESIRLSNSDDLGASERWRLRQEELSVLKLFSRLIVHNKSMKRYLNETFGIPNARMRELGIFDYLTDAPFAPFSGAVIVAGNLSMQKAGYVYYLPQGVDFSLYGPAYEGIPLKNITYHGSFVPDRLAYELRGSFGLVWDGDSADTCSGVWGEYLRYNNPHKTSLYLALGIPVIIWRSAALADFIVKNNCGIAVSSLYDIPDAVKKADISAMRKSAEGIAKKLRAGYYLTRALEL